MVKEYPKRKPNRLQNYDYSQNNAYFITICTKDRINLFGEICDGNMCLNDCGKIAENEILKIPSHYNTVRIDKFVVMPNHVHMIIVINPSERINPFPTETDIPNVIGKYKAGVTRTVGNAFMRSAIWQRSYHDHIIRGEADYQKIWQYIDTNPMKWNLDKYHV